MPAGRQFRSREARIPRRHRGHFACERFSRGRAPAHPATAAGLLRRWDSHCPATVAAGRFTASRPASPRAFRHGTAWHRRRTATRPPAAPKAHRDQGGHATMRTQTWSRRRPHGSRYRRADAKKSRLSPRRRTTAGQSRGGSPLRRQATMVALAMDETEVRAGAGSTRSSRPLPWRSEHLAVTGCVDEQHSRLRLLLVVEAVAQTLVVGLRSRSRWQRRW
jgi:hypothetical protein